ncbi:glutamine-hydrolyzing carbamoyl-phosphate synthase small subunit [Hydrogenoanaerobacterium sp.]|uniref:glutamine-hydrolyzing carbamoyl-phosphate synthase small subunit n=1 Tax=Hydrogenoanaerobacterium sp. TaxID=2953763 RepID=UPI002896622D|nr:glutamine-hydrolyzing carbamoyl-phosphate synthase small subunit [Hydrogenoanaerobacterium sp.]
MSYSKETKQATLLLEDGTVFEGKSFGAQGSGIGEVVFTTGAVGFQETITDPSYCGQIITQTFPLTGNYGINKDDNESAKAYAAGYIAREWCDVPSNFRSEQTIDAFLKAQGIVGIYDIDTRALTIHLRENGTMNGVITTEPISDKVALLAELKDHRLKNAVETVSVKQSTLYKAQGERKGSIALYDFGCKYSIISGVTDQGYDVTVLPCSTPLAEALSQQPDGIVLAGGPGNPDDCSDMIANIKPLLGGTTPVLGIGLGHQLLACAAGGKVTKLKHGHRGGNQPVMDLRLGKTFVTAQNHSYAVEGSSLDESTCEVFCRNINDNTCEGIFYKNTPAFSIQFHPEAFTGAGDTHHYINEFVNMMNARGKK